MAGDIVRVLGSSGIATDTKTTTIRGVADVFRGCITHTGIVITGSIGARRSAIEGLGLGITGCEFAGIIAAINKL